MIIAYSTEVMLKRWPISNIVLILLCVAVVFAAAGLSEDVIDVLVLNDWSLGSLIGYQFLHGGFLHLVFNMLYLWVFGNAVCERIGNVAHGLVFIATGVLAGVVHNIFDGTPAVGASGAINGIIGLYLVLYPVDKVNCFWWFFFRFGTFEIAGFWLILFWFIVDAAHAFSGAEGGIAYWAHVGGFISGVVLGVCFLKSGFVKMPGYCNPTLLDYLGGKRRHESMLAYEKESFITGKPRAPERISERRPRPVASVPVPPDANLDCPECGQNIDVPRSMLGVAFKCPSCGSEIQVDEE